HRPEHVASQYPSAGVLHAALCPLIVYASGAAFVPVHLLPRSRGEEPLEQLRSADAEWGVKTLMRAGRVTVERHRKRADADYGHVMLPFSHAPGLGREKMTVIDHSERIPADN